jgi:hypothetical protein
MGASWARLAVTEAHNLDGIRINTTHDLTIHLARTPSLPQTRGGDLCF